MNARIRYVAYIVVGRSQVDRRAPTIGKKRAIVSPAGVVQQKVPQRLVYIRLATEVAPACSCLSTTIASARMAPETVVEAERSLPAE